MVLKGHFALILIDGSRAAESLHTHEERISRGVHNGSREIIGGSSGVHDSSREFHGSSCGAHSSKVHVLWYNWEFTHTSLHAHFSLEFQY